MLKKLSYPGITMPTLYIAESHGDAQLAAKNGLPFIKWNRSSEDLVKILLRSYLEEQLPQLNWDAILGPREKIDSVINFVPGRIFDDDFDLFTVDDVELVELDACKLTEIDGKMVDATDIAVDEREFSSPCAVTYKEADVYSWCNCDITADIDSLLNLGMLPKFVGDIAGCIRSNLSERMRWTEGYNKKRGCPIGNYNSPGELPNLIILDVSGSIPNGVTSTMLFLIDTLRHQCNANLIITASKSTYYKLDDELPCAEDILRKHGWDNEAAMFYKILDDHVIGKEFGHVISFGDNDCPSKYYGRSYQKICEGTKVHQVHHFHTWVENGDTGYGKWANYASPDAIVYDTSWVKGMDNAY